VFPQDGQQEQLLRSYIRELGDAGIFLAPIATTIEPGQIFYLAERYHFDYATRNPDQPYIRGVSAPKAGKLRQYFPHLLKSAD
jgi:peptide-methionine (S)-S-oxide reductase